MDIVDDESKIIIDVLLCHAYESPHELNEMFRSWKNYFRGHSIKKFYDNHNSIAQSMKAHPTVQMRHVVKQTKSHMSGLNMLNFNGDYTQPAQEQGKQDGKDAVNSQNYSTVDVGNFLNEWIVDEDIL